MNACSLLEVGPFNIFSEMLIKVGPCPHFSCEVLSYKLAAGTRKKKIAFGIAEMFALLPFVLGKLPPAYWIKCSGMTVTAPILELAVRCVKQAQKDATLSCCS